MLPHGIPFPVVPQSTEIMNIIVPNMLQNALTKKMTVAAGDGRRGEEDQGSAWRPLGRVIGPLAAAGPGATPAGRLASATGRGAARLVRHRPDYLYVLPATRGDAARHRLPDLLHGLPLVLQHAAQPRPRRQDLHGLDNYDRVLTAESVHEATWNTLVWTFCSTLLAFVLGFAVALTSTGTLRRGVLRGTLLVPYVITAVAAAYVWRWLFHSDFGVVGAISVATGVTDGPINFLDDRRRCCRR